MPAETSIQNAADSAVAIAAGIVSEPAPIPRASCATAVGVSSVDRSSITSSSNGR